MEQSRRLVTKYVVSWPRSLLNDNRVTADTVLGGEVKFRGWQSHVPPDSAAPCGYLDSGLGEVDAPG